MDHKQKTDDDEKNEALNDQAISVLYNALALSEFNRVKGLEKAMRYERSLWKFMKEHPP
jgi:hypothetical protein